MLADSPEPSRLARRLGLADAVVMGLGAMIGAGIFATVAPAVEAAGSAVIIGLVLAGAVAYCNAASSAQLAALYPESGGTYVYGRRRLGPVWGYLAGWGFVTGKLASLAAMALTFGAYAAPEPALRRPMALGAVAAVAAVNYRGVRKTAALTRVIVAVVLAALAAVVAAVLIGGRADTGALLPLTSPEGVRGVLAAAGLLFFAFAGYARIATLGEEVIEPSRTIPLAITVALALTLAVYTAVILAALAAAGPERLSQSAAPLAVAVHAAGFPVLEPVVRGGAAIASLGVLLSLIAGVSRTAFAMAADGALPAWLAAVHPRFRVPHRAETAAAAIVGAAVVLVDVRGAIGFSAFAVLVYYAIANASALTLPPHQRRWPRWIPAAGLAGCGVLALSLPLSSALSGAAVLAVGALAYRVRRPAADTGTGPDEAS